MDPGPAGRRREGNWLIWTLVWEMDKIIETMVEGETRSSGWAEKETRRKKATKKEERGTGFPYTSPRD